MKLKKLAALAMSCAMVITGGAFFAACGDDKNDGKDDGKNPGGTTSDFVEDTRIWYAVGADSKGTLSDQNWQPFVMNHKFTKDTTKTDENVFTITLDIYAGSQNPGRSFKFLYKTSEDEEIAEGALWNRQVGMQHIEGIDGSDGDAVYKIDGETVFWTADDNGAYNNIFLQKGQEGRYTFTLTTKSDTDPNPVITVKRESRITVNYDMSIIGDMNNFGATTIDMTENINADAANTWTQKLVVTKDMLYRDAEGAIKEVLEGEHEGEADGEYAAVVIRNNRDGKTYIPAAGEGVIIKEVKDFGGNDYTCVLLPEGKYDITFTEDLSVEGTVGGSVVITQSAFDMYLIGSINGWNESTVDQYPMTEQADGSYTAILTVEADAEIKSFNKLGGNNKYSDGANAKLTAGTWAVKYDPDTNTIQVEKLGYYMVGAYGGMDNISGWENGLKAGKAVALEDNGEGVYSAEVELTTADEFKIVFGSVIGGVSNWDVLSGANKTVEENGTYTITITISGETVEYSAVKKA